MQLTSEETLLLLTSRIYLSFIEDRLLAQIATKPGLNWDYVLWRAEIYRTLPLVHYHLTRIEVLRDLPEPARYYLDAWTALSRARSGVMYDEMLRICDAFTREGVEYFLMKGAAISLTMSPDPSLRPMLDLDLMINPGDVPRARAVMSSLGYAHALWNADTNVARVIPDHEIAEYQYEHYELPGYLRLIYRPSRVSAAAVPATWRRKHLKFHIDMAGTCCFPVFVDLHINLSLDFELTDTWKDVTREKLLERDVLVQSPTGMVWFIASRLYHEAFQQNALKLIMFGDLHTILHKRGEQVDWIDMTRIARKYGLQPSLYYVLAQLARLTGATVPSSFIDSMKPGSLGVPAKHDWGDVMTKLFSRTELHDVRLATPQIG